MSINLRIKKIREQFCNDSNKEFAKKMNKNPSAVNNWVRESTGVGLVVVQELLETFTEINANWLITGNGEMLKPANSGESSTGGDGSVTISKVVGGGNVIGNVTSEKGKTCGHTYNTNADAKEMFEIIKDKDNYIRKIIKESFERNERKKAEISKLTDQIGSLNVVIANLTNHIIELTKKQ
jgi:hypothetical protein